MPYKADANHREIVTLMCATSGCEFMSRHHDQRCPRCRSGVAQLDLRHYLASLLPWVCACCGMRYNPEAEDEH